ncbi:MAG: response regulator [Calditrichia bacterium]|jgi:DNA-binding NtrC family response regulator|nr:response regulator [Calditrichia bacterium]
MKRADVSTNGVLILEDDKDLADSIRVFLEDVYSVYIIDDPSEIKTYITKYRIKLLVTDLDMPHPNLRNKLQSIKSSNPGIKIILMYMFLDEDGQKDSSILKEADDYIFKPFDADVFRYKVDRLLA